MNRVFPFPHLWVVSLLPCLQFTVSTQIVFYKRWFSRVRLGSFVCWLFFIALNFFNFNVSGSGGSAFSGFICSVYSPKTQFVPKTTKQITISGELKALLLGACFLHHAVAMGGWMGMPSQDIQPATSHLKKKHIFN